MRQNGRKSTLLCVGESAGKEIADQNKGSRVAASSRDKTMSCSEMRRSRDKVNGAGLHEGGICEGRQLWQSQSKI